MIFTSIYIYFLSYNMACTEGQFAMYMLIYSIMVIISLFYFVGKIISGIYPHQDGADFLRVDILLNRTINGSTL